MSRQVKTNREKVIDHAPLLAKVLEIKGKEIKEFALECGIPPDTLKKAVGRKRLSTGIIATIHDKFNVRKGYWKDGKEPIFEEKHTNGIKSEQPDIWQHPVVKNLERELETTREYVTDLKRQLNELRSGK